MSRLAIALPLAALVAWSFAQRWGVLAASPFPLGVDGYFYATQVRSLLEHGTLQYPASPLTFWWMAPFAAVTDPIVGAKLAAALGGALVALPAYGVGARLGGGRGPGLVAAAVATASAGSAYLSIEFVKQGIGLTVALAALWLVLRAIEAPSRGRLAAAAAAVIAAWLAHKMAAAIVAIAIPVAIEQARKQGALRGRRLLYVVGALAALLVIAIALGLAAPARFVSGGDVSLLGHMLGRHAHWDAPALATSTVTLAFDHEALAAGTFAVAAAVALANKPLDGGLRVLAWIAIALGVATALPWLNVSDPQGLAFRLRIAAFVPLALVVAIMARVVPAAHQTAICAIAGLAFVAYAATRDRTEGEIVTHPALVTSAIAAGDYLPADATAIVPERHIAFMLAWYAHAKVALRPERVPYAERVRVMPLNFIGEGSPLDHALDAARAEPGIDPPIGVHPRHRNGMVIVREPTWAWLLAQLPPATRRHFAAWPTI